MDNTVQSDFDFRAQFYNTSGNIAAIPVDAVTFSREHYTRTESQNPSKVQEYAKSISGGGFPPIMVNQDGILLDGWHRWMAHKSVGLETIEAEFLDTSKMDIHEIRRKAARSNFRHGIPQTERELKKLIRDEYRAKMEGADQAGREALKRAMATDYSRSSAYIREVTSRIDKDFKAELREIAFEQWMACHSQQEIARAVGYSEPVVSQFCKTLREFGNATGGVSELSSEKSSLANSAIPQDFDEDDENDDPNSLGVYRLDSRLLVKANHVDETYRPPLYNIWKQQERGEQTSHFGNSEITWLDHLLYLYTKPFDIVVDPFAGGGSTIDLCKSRLRRYLVSDRKPIDIRTDIREHDIANGVLSPPQWKDVRLVYLDPPYWRQAAGQYSNDPTDLGNMELDAFNDALSGLIKQYAEKLKRSNGGQTHIALIIQPTQWKSDDNKTYTDHVGDMLRAVKLPVDMRYSVPYESQQCTAQMVEWAKKQKRCLVLTREIVVWKVS